MLGLDSISAIRIASQARKAGINLRMGEIVAGETIDSILSGRATANGAKTNGHANGNGHVTGNGHAHGRSVRQRQVPEALAKQVSSKLGVDAESIEGVLPILAGQKLWLATWAKSKEGCGDGGFSFAYRLAGVSKDKAEMTWVQLRQLHPILRTAFLLEEDGSAAQVVLKTDSESRFVEVPVENGDPEQAAKKVVARRAAEGWPDLTDPPVQLTLVGDVLVFSLHHVLYDAFSIEMLVRNFAQLYHGAEAVSSNQWIEAVEHVAEEQQQVRTDAEQYWEQALSETGAGLLSANGSDLGAGEAFHAKRQAIKVESEVEAKLRKAGVTLPAVVLAAWSTLLSERLGNDAASKSPVFGLYQLGRSAAFDSIEKVQGPLLNMLPIQVKGESLLDKTRHATKDLRTRAKFEQTDLVDAHRWSGLSTDKPTYNTFVNLLIGSDHANDDENSSATTSKELQPIDLGHPLTYSVKDANSNAGPPQTKAKAVAQHAAIFQPDVNLDIVLGGEGGADVAIKAKTSVVPEAQLPKLIERLVELVHETLDQL